MRYSNPGAFRQQARFLRHQFLQDGESPFKSVLSEEVVAKRDSGQNRLARSDLFAARYAVGFFGPGFERGPFVPRGGRPLDRPPSIAGTATVLCRDGRLLPSQEATSRKVLFGRGCAGLGELWTPTSIAQWLWKSRRVYVYDGSSVSMPDTAENQCAYPQPICQKPGLGFPLARIAAIFSLACGAVLDVGICRYAGKGQSELGMLRTLWSLFLPGDIMLADRLMCTWTELVMLKERGVECVCRLTSHRTADFRRGERLGKNDHIVKWVKPAKPRSIDRETYAALPEFLTIRECRVQVEQPGFRIWTLVIATTLLNADAFTINDLAELYRARWNAELDLRSLKQTLQMDVLRCKTRSLSGRSFGRTSWPTISSVRSRLRRQPNTPSNRGRSASRGRSKHSKPFSQ